jgi:hypothetical protein
MYSSSEGELEHGYSIYSDQNYLESDADMSNYSNMSLPILRIPTSSPPGSPARSARSPSHSESTMRFTAYQSVLAHQLQPILTLQTSYR